MAGGTKNLCGIWEGGGMLLSCGNMLGACIGTVCEDMTSSFV